MPLEASEFPLTLFSPTKRVRAELSVETVWIGATVYPECPVWRVWFDGQLVVDASTAGLMTRTGPLAYGMRLVKVARHRQQTGIGPGRVLVSRFAGRDARELEVTLRVTDLSAWCALRQPRKRTQDGGDLSVTRFPEGSVLLGSPAARGAAGGGPQVRFAPSGKLVAFWGHGLERHVVFFDRPGDLAVRRFGALKAVDALEVADGRQGCEHLFLTVPFTRSALPAPVFGEAVTPAFREAFKMLLGRDEPSDDFWMLRGEPGDFAVAARRQGARWMVAGVTAGARTLTVRFEDLWLRMPAALRAGRYTVSILRDPTKDEGGAAVEESFQDQAPDLRVALDLRKDGGFLLAFTPQDELGSRLAGPLPL